MDQENFWSLVDFNGYLGCWVWKGRKDWFGRNSGHPYYEGKRANEIAYSLLRKEFNPEMDYYPDFCGNELCVNPDHMRTRIHGSI